MDPTTDPRLQHYASNVDAFNYNPHVTSSLNGTPIYNPNVQPYAINLHQTIHSTPNSAVASPQRTVSLQQRNGVVGHLAQRNPQVRTQSRLSLQAQSHANTIPVQTQISANAGQQLTQNNGNLYNTPTQYTTNLQQPIYLQHVDDSAFFTSPTSTIPQHPQPTQILTNTTPSSIPNHLLTTATPIEPTSITDSPNPLSSTFPLIPNPPSLSHWRHKLFNITSPLLLTENEYLTYFPHVDNVYSHRSTQKYKRKPFVSHYWDCRLKGRPSGTKKSDDPNKKKRKRTARERDLCDVKIKITEYFSWDECRRLGLAIEGTAVGGEGGIGKEMVDGSIVDGLGLDLSLTGHQGQHQRQLLPSATGYDDSNLTIVLEDGVTDPLSAIQANNPNNAFGVLEPSKQYPKGHPGADGKRWFMVQRVSGNAGSGGAGGDDAEEDQEADGKADLDHKHSLEESDRIKKNSVQRWLLKEEKEKKGGRKSKSTLSNNHDTSPTSSSSTFMPNYLASGQASHTARIHKSPAASNMTLFANSYCPFAQRVWIALEVKDIPYQFVEITPEDLPTKHIRFPEMAEVNPDGHVPCLRHGNWAVWESVIMMEYLEDLAMGHSLLPLGNPRLRAHCRLWIDHINRKILPSFYSLLLTPPPERNMAIQSDASNTLDLVASNSAEKHSMLITTLHNAITNLVNSSHATGPFFLGSEISFVDVAFAPWIIRLSRVLSYYRNFPRPEVGTRWQQWVDAIEADERIRRTVSDDNSYYGVYRGVGEDGWFATQPQASKKTMVEMAYAKTLVAQDGFGLGGDIWGKLDDMRHAGDIR